MESDVADVPAVSGVVVCDTDVRGEVVRGVLVSDGAVTGMDCVSILLTKFGNGTSSSTTDALLALPDCNGMTLKSFQSERLCSLEKSMTAALLLDCDGITLKSIQSGRLCSLVKSKIGFMATSLTLSTCCCGCEAKRLSNSATHVVSSNEAKTSGAVYHQPTFFLNAAM